VKNSAAARDFSPLQRATILADSARLVPGVERTGCAFVHASCHIFFLLGVMAVKTKWFLAIVFPLVMVLAVPAFVWAEGWSMPNLNPFSSSKSKKDTSWKWPGQQPAGKSSFASQRSPQPTTWQKLSQGTANTWNKTSATINPWHKETTAPTRNTATRRPSNLPGKQPPPTTWYNPTTWFGEKKPERGSHAPGSVSEFLNQPRVPY
jgi:hypothetical protein